MKSTAKIQNQEISMNWLLGSLKRLLESRPGMTQMQNKERNSRN